MNVIKNKAAEHIKIKPDADEDTDNIGSVNEKFPSTIKYEAGKINPFSLHPPTHTNKKPVTRDVKCSQKPDIVKRMLKHTGDKPFSCNFCDYKFSRQAHLKSHILTHTGEKPFSCDLCNYKSTQRCHLKTHMLTDTGEKPFSCHFCDYKSCLRSDLKIHMLTHTREKPFSLTL